MLNQRSIDENNSTALSVGRNILKAVCNKNLELVKELLAYAKEHKEDDWDDWGDRATENHSIHYAIIDNNLDMFKLLIENGADVHSKNKDGETPLILALADNNIQIIAELLKKDAGGYILNAVVENNLELTNKLLSHTKEHKQSWNNWRYIDTKNYAIHHAVINNNIDMVKLLIENGADILKKNKDDMTPLLLALTGDNKQIIVELIKHDDTLLKDAGNYILKAVIKNDLVLTKSLLSFSNELNLDWDNSYISKPENYALHHAVINKNLAMVNLLLENGADFHKPNQNGKTALLLASEEGASSIESSILMFENKKHLKDRIESGEVKSVNDIFNFDLRKINTKTLALCINEAIKIITQELDTYSNESIEEKGTSNRANTVKMYLELNKKLESFPTHVRLEQAIIEDAMKMVKQLLNYDLLNQALGIEKLTPLEMAMKYNKKEIAHYLIMHGAKINKITGENKEIQKLIIQYTSAESIIDDTIFKVKKRNEALCSSIDNKLSMDTEMKKTEIELTTFSKELLTAISELLNNLLRTSDVITVNEKIDIYFLINNLLNAVAKSETKSQLIEKIKFIFSEREDAILNTSMDYCYADHSPVNHLCFLLAEKISKNTTPQNILLKNACTNDRFGTLADVQIITEKEFKNSKTNYPEYGNYILVINETDCYIRTATFEAELKEISYESILKDITLMSLAKTIAKLPKVEKISELTSPGHAQTLKNIKEIIKIYHTRTPAKWFDPAIGIEETALPEVTRFFRLPGNEIHIYSYVANQAIARLKGNNRLLEHIWFGTDPKNTTPIPPLNSEALALLKQKSTLRKLIEYTEYLDKCTRELSETDVYTQFEILQKGLLAGNYKVTGDHRKAAGPAYAAIAAFADWWNRLKGSRPDLCEKIRSLSHVRHTKDGDYIETLGGAIDILFDQENLDNNERANNAIYCIDLKAHKIERLLNEPTVSKALKEIQIDKISRVEINLVSDTVLDQWEKQINAELEQKSSPILVSDCGKFPKNITCLELNSLFISQGLIQNYSNLFIREKNIIDDTNYFIKYIFAEKDNTSLLKLREILSRPEFDYLRTHGLNSEHYAFFKGETVQTSKHYAFIQKALSEQMILNTTADKTSKEEACTAVHALCNENRFITYKTTKPNWFNLFFNSHNEYSTLFNGRTSLKSSRETLMKKIAEVKNQVMKLS